MSEQANWRFCQRCYSMFYDGNPEKGSCPGNISFTGHGPHVALLDRNFTLSYELPESATAQAAWRGCSKCGVLFFDGFAQKGQCAFGGVHEGQSYNFTLPHEVAETPNTQAAWRFCHFCNAMYYDGFVLKGACAGHPNASSGVDAHAQSLPGGLGAPAPPPGQRGADQHAQHLPGGLGVPTPPPGQRGADQHAQQLPGGVVAPPSRQQRVFYSGHEAAPPGEVAGFDFVLPYEAPAPAPSDGPHVTYNGPIWTVSLNHQQAEAVEGLLSTFPATGQAAGWIQMMDALGGDQGVDVTGVLGLQGLMVTPEGSGFAAKLAATGYAVAGASTIIDYIIAGGSKVPAVASAFGITGASAAFAQVAAGNPLGWALVAAVGGLMKLLEAPPDPNDHGGIHADRNSSDAGVPGEWERFLLSEISPENHAALLSWLGLFSAQGGGGGDVYANRPQLGDWETWTLLDNHDGTYSFQAMDGKHFLTATNGGGPGSFCLANAQGITVNERFKINFLPDGHVTVQTVNGHFLSVQPGK